MTSTGVSAGDHKYLLLPCGKNVTVSDASGKSLPFSAFLPLSVPLPELYERFDDLMRCATAADAFKQFSARPNGSSSQQEISERQRDLSAGKIHCFVSVRQDTSEIFSCHVRPDHLSDQPLDQLLPLEMMIITGTETTVSTATEPTGSVYRVLEIPAKTRVKVEFIRLHTGCGPSCSLSHRPAVAGDKQKHDS